MSVKSHEMVRMPDGGILHRLTHWYPAFDGTQHCANQDILAANGVDIWYEHTNPNLGKKVCDGCPFIVECREWGIAHEKWGIWGGLTPRQRRRRREIRRQGFVDLNPADWIYQALRARVEREE